MNMKDAFKIFGNLDQLGKAILHLPAGMSLFIAHFAMNKLIPAGRCNVTKWKYYENEIFDKTKAIRMAQDNSLWLEI